MGFFRLLLAIAVMFDHTGPWHGFKMIPGQLSVELFFLLSGFYMFMVWDYKYSHKSNGAVLFWVNRYLRLWPLYILTVIFIFLFLKYAGATPFLITVAPRISLVENLALWFSNITLLLQDIVCLFDFPGNANGLALIYENTPNQLRGANLLFVTPSWSLSIELFFYLLVPFLFRKHLLVLVTFIVLSLSWRIWIILSHILPSDPWIYRFIPAQIGLFAGGGLVYRFYNRHKNLFDIPHKFGPGLILLLVICSWTYWPIRPILNPLREAWLVLLWAACIPFLFHAFKSSKTDALLGDMSYPFYLIHVPVISFLVIQGFPLAQLAPFCLLVTLGLSLMLSIWVERPLDKLRHKISFSGLPPAKTRTFLLTAPTMDSSENLSFSSET